METSPNNLPESIDVLNRLRITSCPSCGIVFALPQHVWSQRLNDFSAIHCPNGDVIELRDTPESRENLAIINIELLTEIAQTRHELVTARHEIARLPHPPESPISEAELKRRIELTASRAPRLERGRPICIHCGKTFAASGFRVHLKREHAETISTLPASCFD